LRWSRRAEGRGEEKSTIILSQRWGGFAKIKVEGTFKPKEFHVQVVRENS